MTLRFALIALLVAAAPALAAPPVDPPGRVGRLSYAEGDVSFSPAGEDGWYGVQLNRPQVAGDRIWVARRARAELELGGAALRADQNTGVEILTLDDRDVQVQLTQGTLNVHVRRVWQGQSYEIATPTLALVVRAPGDFRVDVDDRGAWTEIVAWRGTADVYGERARFSLREGDAVRFEDPRLRGYDLFDPPPPDSFDRFVEERNRREERALARRYVPDDMIGYADLDDYGRWSNDPQYGALWYPRVAAGWAPYRDGRWIWQDPWGWTWVDDAPWGFAPFHYGRWVRVNARWAWLPSPQRSRATYAPALVAFVGGGGGYGGGIGWFPLGPSDVYVPGYRASQGYFNRVNEYRWIDNRVANDAWSGYSSGRVRYDRMRYQHRDRDSMTVVNRDSFVNGRNANRSRVQPGQNFSASAQVSALANMAPVQNSLAGGAAAARTAVDEDVFDRRVMARRVPDAGADVSFEQRRQAWQRNPGQPIASDELARMGGRAPAPEVKVVGEAGPDLRGQRGAGERSGEGSRRDDAAPATPGLPRPAEPERGRGRDDGGADQQRRELERQQRDAQRQQQQAADEQQRAADEQRREVDRQQRGAQRQQQAAGEAQRAAEQQQREAERQQQAAEEQQRAERQRYEQEQRDRENERNRQAGENAQRQLEREQAAAEAERMQRQQQEAERGRREADQQQREAERAQREAQQEAERRQRDADQQREAERAQREAQQESERQQREAEQQQREAERAQREAQQESERQQREAEQQQREAERAEREAQKEAEQEQREQEREARSRDRDEGSDQQQE